MWSATATGLRYARSRGNGIMKFLNDSSFPARTISVSSVSCLKEINKVEEGKKIVIEAKYVPSPREKYLAKEIAEPSSSSSLTSSSQPRSLCPCSLCKLGLDIKHTDVLILSQFTDSKGKQLPRTVTGLCKEQDKRVDYLLVMAEKAGLMDRYTETGKRELIGWESLNKYYDESVIEGFLQYKRKRHC